MRHHSFWGAVCLLLMIACSSVQGQDAIYVADQTSEIFEGVQGRILRVDPATGDRRVFSGVYGLSMVNMAQNPRTGDIYVTDNGVRYDGRAVWRITTGGQMLHLSGRFYGGGVPYLNGNLFGVAILEDDTVLVANRDALLAIDPSTGVRSVFADQSNLVSGSYAEPIDLAVGAPGTVYMAGRWQLQALEVATREIRVVSGPGVGSGPELSNLLGLDVDAQGRVLGVDRRTVLRIDPATGDRSVLTDSSAQYSGPLLRFPTDLLATSDGGALVSDSELLSIVRVQPNGSRSILSGNPEFGEFGSGPRLQAPVGLLRYSEDEILVIDQMINAIVRVSLTDGARSIFDPSVAGGGDYIPSRPVSLGRTLDGDLLMGDQGWGALFEIDVDTGARTLLSGSGEGAIRGTGPSIGWPLGPREAVPGQVFVGRGSGQAISTVSMLTGNRATLSDGANLSSFRDLDISPLGRLYALTSSRGVVEVDPFNGARFPLPNDAGTGFPIGNGMSLRVAGESLAYAVDNELYAVHRINLFTGNRTIATGYALGPNVGQGPRLLSPQAVDTERSGDLLVLDRDYQNEGSHYLGILYRVAATTGDRVVLSGYDTDANQTRGRGLRLQDVRDVVVARAPGAPRPTLRIVTPDALEFSGPGGVQELALTRRGSGTLPWEASIEGGAPWLNIVAGENGTNDGTVGIMASANVTGSDRFGVVRIGSPGAGNPLMRIPVRQGIGAAVGTIRVSPVLRNVGAAAGTTSFSVENTGAGTVNWSASIQAGASWLAVVSGEAGTNSGTITVSYGANSGGARSGTLRVSPSGGGIAVDVQVAQAGADCNAPGAPGGLSASEGTSSEGVSLTWNAVAGADQYRIYRSLSEDFSQAAELGFVNGTTYTDTDAPRPVVSNSGCQQSIQTVDAFYWVAVVNECGTGARSGPERGYAGSGNKFAAAGSAGDGSPSAAGFLLFLISASVLLGACFRFIGPGPAGG